MKLKKIVSTWLHSSDLSRTKDFMTKLGLSPLAENDKLIIFSYEEGGPNTAYYLYPEPLNDGQPLRKGGGFILPCLLFCKSLIYCIILLSCLCSG